jgi:hypothetical protein
MDTLLHVCAGLDASVMLAIASLALAFGISIRQLACRVAAGRP